MRAFNSHSVCLVFISTNSRHIVHSPHVMLLFFFFSLKHFFLNNEMSDKGDKKIVMAWFHSSILLPLKNKNKPSSHNFATKQPKSLPEKNTPSSHRKNMLIILFHLRMLLLLLLCKYHQAKSSCFLLCVWLAALFFFFFGKCA